MAHDRAMKRSSALRNQIPERTAPMRLVSQGPSQVADISKKAAMPRNRATVALLMFCERRYVMNCPENDKAVKYSSARANEGRNAGWRKYDSSVLVLFDRRVLMVMFWSLRTHSSVDLGTRNAGTAWYTRAMARYSIKTEVVLMLAAATTAARVE